MPIAIPIRNAPTIKIQLQTIINVFHMLVLIKIKIQGNYYYNAKMPPTIVKKKISVLSNRDFRRTGFAWKHLHFRGMY